MPRRRQLRAIMSKSATAKYMIGQVVKHRVLPFRGVVFDIDPEFANTEEWYQAIPADARPRKDQPFYHLFAENSETQYIAYVSEQNLLPDYSGEPVGHPQIGDVFDRDSHGGYRRRNAVMN
jgi:heat shock protein HspQ